MNEVGGAVLIGGEVCIRFADKVRFDASEKPAFFLFDDPAVDPEDIGDAVPSAIGDGPLLRERPPAVDHDDVIGVSFQRFDGFMRIVVPFAPLERGANVAAERFGLFRIEHFAAAFFAPPFEINIEVNLFSKFVEIVDFIRRGVIEKPKNFHLPLIMAREVIIVS